MSYKPLPIGIDDFKEIIQKKYYYVDKTLLIKDLLDMGGEVNLFTRPRRFGKTLNMSMLKYFFENGNEKTEELFVETKIMSAGQKYLEYMGKYPVISLSLKSMKQASYEDAVYCLKEEISREYKRHDEIIEGLKYESDREKYLRIIDMKAEPEEYLTAIKFLSQCLYQYYDTKAIILIDEYDVPLENAYFGGFYDKMIALIRSLFESALKTNENLEFAVITGCLRISKESIFTGLNNLKIMSITVTDYAEHFGFTQKEVDDILAYYNISQNRDIVKQWYDGYLFGDAEVYNPWSVMNYAGSCFRKNDTLPVPYWSNTSSNSIVHSLVERADLSVKQEIEALIEGKTITKPIHEDITYEDVESSQDNLWNFLFFTGYLKKISEKQMDEIRYIEMAIPNSEVRYVYRRTVMRWFDEQVKRKDLSALYGAMVSGNAQVVEKELALRLRESISFYDNKEAFYHGFLVGLLSGMEDYLIDSNREAGDGRYDICVRSLEVEKPVVILELKQAASYHEMDKKAQEAIQQIRNRNYKDALMQDGYQEVICYGIGFYKKNCKVVLEREKI